MRNLDFKKVIFMGSLIGGVITYSITQLYINKHYTFNPYGTYILDVYKNMLLEKKN